MRSEEDRVRQLKRNKKLITLVSIAAVAALFAAAFRTALVQAQLDPPLWGYLLGIILLYVILIAAFMLAMILHEAGHLLLGLCSGFKFSSFNIAGLLIQKKDGRLRFKHQALPGAAGQCLMVPGSQNLNYVLYNHGGWLLNLITGLVMIPLYLLSHNAFMQFAWAAFGICNLYLAAVNGIPTMTAQGLSNDGLNGTYLENPKVQDALSKMLLIQDGLGQGLTFDQLDPAWFVDYSTADLKNPLLAQQQMMLENRYFYLEDEKNARLQIQKMLNPQVGLSDFLKAGLRLDEMTYLIQNGQLDAARNIYLRPEVKQFRQVMKQDVAVLRSEYLYLLYVEKNEVKAAKVKRQFDEALKNCPYAAIAETERKLTESIQPA